MARQMDDMAASGASKSQYIHWLMVDKLSMTDSEVKKYSKLLNSLLSVEFVWIHPMDENRAIDGLDLRDKFSYETDLYLDASSGLTVKCSMLEMMAALAIRIESQIMRNLSIGDRTSKWFFVMIDNLGLNGYSDKAWKTAYGREVEEICKKVIYRDYKPDGTGGLFPIKNNNQGKNWKNEQIWNQCMAYLSENYPNDDPDLALYS